MRFVVRRPPRGTPPAQPDPVRVASPPELPEQAAESAWVSLLPLGATLGSAAFLAMPGQAASLRVLGALLVASSCAMALAQLYRTRSGASSRLRASRQAYLAALARSRRAVCDAEHRRRVALLRAHPAAAGLWTVPADPARLWERRPGDEDFLQLRVGVGSRRGMARAPEPPAAPERVDPLSAQALRRLLEVHELSSGLPVTIPLRRFRQVTVHGERGVVLGMVRALVAQLVALHAPGELAVAVCCAPENATDWEWTKWLPHLRQPNAADAMGERLLFHTAAAGARALVEERPADAGELVVVLDGVAPPPEATGHAATRYLTAACGTHACPEGWCTSADVPADTSEWVGRWGPFGRLCLQVRQDLVRLQAVSDTASAARPELLGPHAAEALARQLAPLCPAAASDEAPLSSSVGLPALLGVDDPSHLPAPEVCEHGSDALLRVPIGVGSHGRPVVLDLKEAARGGVGPHGVCVGATGSGKSELLRTLVLGLAMTHSSAVCNVVLVDFKGGATFTGLAGLPHVAALITNLEGESELLDRMADALNGELQRRQELLRSSGGYDGVEEYEDARAAGADLPPLPSLLVVIDEFSELLAARPDFIDLFLRIGRIGRSLGVHLLLASQRLEEGRLRGLDSYFSYRIGLRTFSAAESRAILGVADAYQLPSVPGRGYLSVGTEELTTFQAALVSGAAERPEDAACSGADVQPPPARRPLRFTAASPPPNGAQTGRMEATGRAAETGAAGLPRAGGASVLDVVARQLGERGPPARRVWLPPLRASPPLDELLPDLRVDTERGLQAAGLEPLAVPVGVVDRPREQRRALLRLDFSSATGNALLVGGPRSGKSTALRTLLASFALTHTPAEVQFYCLDLGGGLSCAAGFPHVGAMVRHSDRERVHRLVSEVLGVLNRRARMFPEWGVESVEQFRELRAHGAFPDEAYGDVFLVVDGWNALRQDFDELVPGVTELAARGLAYGVHLFVTAGRYGEVPPAVRDLLLTRVELRLGDPLDSEVDRQAAQGVPLGAPGRGLTPRGLHCLLAEPRLSRHPDAAVPGSGGDGPGGAATVALGQLAQRVREHWHGQDAPPVLVLPRTVPAHRLPAGEADLTAGLPLGLDEADLTPVRVDFHTDPHLLVFGDGESGKTATLRLLLRQVGAAYTPDQARIVLGDYRGALLDAAPERHLLRHAATEPALRSCLTEVAEALHRRFPGDELTPRQLRTRGWWSGPELFVVLDDYDLIAAGAGDPVEELRSLLPLAREIGLHLLVARRTGGAARALFEPVLRQLSEAGTQGVLLSGDRAEGPLLSDLRPEPLPPGRGRLVRRRGVQLLQVAWLPEPG